MDHDQYTEFFCPPLWRQRRIFIQETLARFNIQTVLDYGCGEAAVLSYLIPENDHTITKMAGIDICDQVLVEAIDRCTPWKTDFEQLRNHPLIIDIFKGSIGEPDDRFLGFEGIICTEVIEHVYTPVLDSFLDITLGLYQPRILVVTTPNGEYNVNFPDLKYGTDESTFRHNDHKFEWTRKEFKDWCNEGAAKYNYDVEYHGIGLLHGKYDELEYGYCTQACIFIRRETKATQPTSLGTPHELLKHIEFPYFNEPPPPKDKMIQEILHFIEALCISETNVKKPFKPIDSYQEDDKLVIDLETDWSKFNIDEVIIPQQDLSILDKNETRYTNVPIHLPISSLWHILRIRQLCETKENMIEILSLLDHEQYELVSDSIIVKSRFIVDNTDSHSATSFSSRGSW